ncbi:helix-turn-helix domain-containing protein, partial [Escherichia coli]|uniref:helix-turn-helix domain-containing protein n=1 Tax=Escherichia coli TaxID=562 RepID=UPI002026B847
TGGTADRNRSHWSTSKTPSHTKSVSWQHHPLIDDNIREEILRPEWIAGETGMSVRSLYRMFADKGLVVAQYIRNRRLDFCADAIRHAADDEKLAGIGFHWGFSDQSHFSTVFKQRFGMTPGEYRRKFR